MRLVYKINGNHHSKENVIQAENKINGISILFWCCKLKKFESEFIGNAIIIGIYKE